MRLSTQLLHSLHKLRNIGIVAHIDAGKTSLTERILQSAGAIRAAGSVDTGDTVTDFLQPERDRGITISAAAVTFRLAGHSVTLIDTPGHVDFAFEVRTAVRVLDSAIVVLDGTRGIEAQTLSAWQQASNHSLPAAIFVNKLDLQRADPAACVASCLSSVARQLGVTPLLVTKPLLSGAGRLIGVRNLLQEEAEDGEGPARLRLVETLAEADSDLAEDYLAAADPKSMPRQLLVPALARATRARRLLPVFCGSAKSGVGVPDLLQAVVQLLPAPQSQPAELNGALCALAFKSVLHPVMGQVTFLRIYSGKLHKQATVLNCSRNCSERITQLLLPFADDFQPTAEAGVGQIVAVAGLRRCRAGDLLTDSADSAGAVRRHMPDTALQAAPPVLFASVEPDAPSGAKRLEEALNWASVEDPGVRVQVDEESGQTLVCAQGELHLEVVQQRLRQRLGDCGFRFGRPAVAYRERLAQPISVQHRVQAEAHGQRVDIDVAFDVLPLEGEGVETDADTEQTEEISNADEDSNDSRFSFINSINMQWSNHPPQVTRALKQGVLRAMRAGPLVRGRVTNWRVAFHELRVSRRNTAKFASAIAAATFSACRRHLKEQQQLQLTEPHMQLQLHLTQQQALTSVLNELARRECSVERVDSLLDSSSVVVASGAVSQLVGLSSALRSAAAGKAAVSLHFIGYRPVANQELALRRIRYGEGV